MNTKVYALLALAVGAALVGPGRALAAPTQAQWDACMIVNEDEAYCALILNGRPGDDTSGGGTGGDTGGGTGGDTGGGTGGDTGGGTGGDTGGGTGGDTGGGTGGDTGGGTGGGSTPPPPAPQQPPQCANGKHSGHSVSTSGNSSGHRCVGDNQRHGHHHRHDHGRRHGHAHKAKAAVHRFVSFCQSFFSHHGHGRR